MKAALVRALLDHYPRIYFACHTRHVRDPQTGREISAHQATILDHLDELEPMNLTDLAEHMGVTPGTMSIAVERLARNGYVTRQRNPADGRGVHLRVSPAGLRVREAKSVLDPERVKALLACLPPAERAEGIRGLALLARAADEAMRRQAGGGAPSKDRAKKISRRERRRS
jgi:DNA-binding MarR family transcriptional regulator